MWKACNAHLLPGGGRHGGGDVRAAVAPPATPGYGNGDAAAGLALRRKRGARPRAAPGGRRRRLAARSAEKGATGRGRPGLVEAAEEMRGLLTGRLLDGLRLREGATRLLDAAALKWGPGGLLQRSIALFLAGFLGATIITANTHPLMALAAAAVLGLLPLWYVRRKGRRRVHRSEEHTSELQSLRHLVCRLLLEKKKKHKTAHRQDPKELFCGEVDGAIHRS